MRLQRIDEQQKEDDAEKEFQARLAVIISLLFTLHSNSQRYIWSLGLQLSIPGKPPSCSINLQSCYVHM